MLRRILLVVVLALLAWLAWEWIRFPNVAKLADERPRTTAFMEQRKRLLRSQGKSDELEWQWVAYGRISPNLRRAVLVAEDNEFYEHEGVDVKAMREAFERNWKRGKITHGGSTITQQLAKNLYLSPSRNPLRKLREYFIARSLEKHLTKKRILEVYLNVVEMGERIYGAEAAARHYFGKSAASLTPREAALLAGCLPNPRVMSPANPNKRLRRRQTMILSRMRRWGYVFERQVLADKKPEKEVSTTDTATTETALDTAATAPVTDTDLAPPTETETTGTPVPEEQPEAGAPTTQTDSTVTPPPMTDTTTTE